MGQIVNRRRVFGGGGIDYSKQYLTITALEEGFVDLNLCDSDGEHGISTDYMTSVSYSTNGGRTWTTRQNTGDVIFIEVYLYEGQQVLFKGIANSYYDSGAWGHFQLDPTCSVSGNIMSLLYGDNFIGQTSLPSGTHTFYSMFGGCSTLADISNLVMPATTLAENCYDRLFYNCSGLTSIPSGLLPATTLTSYCYSSMFDGCSSLTSIPSDLLPATTMTLRCYGYMFQNCASLTTIPSGLLPATALAERCYHYMFSGCSSLTLVPSNLLPATTMADYCYYYMFRGTGITSIPSGFLPATTLAQYCYSYMFLNSSVASVPSNLLPATTLATGCYRAMFSTCPSLTAAPDLPASTCVAYCYRSMFYQCSSIRYMRCLATSGLNTTECTQYWLTGNPGGGTFHAKSGVSWTSGTSGIPSNWTRVNE